MVTKSKDLSGDFVVNKLTFWGFLMKIYEKRQKNKYRSPITDEDRKESAKVKALNKQISALEKINDSLHIEIEELLNHTGTNNKNSMEEKALDVISKLFLDKPTRTAEQTSLGGYSPQLESGREYSDEELKTIVKATPKKFVKLAKTLPKSTVINEIKKAYPDMSDTSIEKGIQLICEG